MTPREVLSLATDLLGLSDQDAERRIARALAWTRIEPDVAGRAVRHGGHALAERTGLAAALVGDPEVLLLEDPLRSVALDERTRLLGLPGPRRTVILASRYPEREAGLFSHVALVRAGGLAMLAPMAELESARLPLSVDGIAALARRSPRAAGPVPPLRQAARTR
jgi:ABC-2 type transport system ATP-binding protein